MDGVTGAPPMSRIDRILPRRSWVRTLAIAIFLLFWLGITVGLLEFVGRKFLVVWHQEIGYRHFQPYFMTGGYNDQLVPGVKNYFGAPAPEAYGYTEQGGVYVYDFEQEVSSMADRGDLFFQDRVDLADAVDQKDYLRVFAIGGSAAYGIGASSEDRRWYALLEHSLSESLARQVRIIPAAMPGYISTQERLILEFMVLPRKPDAVIVFDGFNDALLPAIFGSRPGDPYDQGILYEQFYSPLFGVKKWLAQHSHLYFFLFHRSVGRTLRDNKERIIQEPARLQTYVRSVTSVYLENIQAMWERCHAKGIPFMVFLQPIKSLTLKHQGGNPERWQNDVIGLGTYRAVLNDVRAKQVGESFHDLTGVFDQPGQDQWYIDSVHFTDPGHRAVAQAMHPIVQKAMQAIH